MHMQTTKTPFAGWFWLELLSMEIGSKSWIGLDQLHSCSSWEPGYRGIQGQEISS